jgi:hypothetical protein
MSTNMRTEKSVIVRIHEFVESPFQRRLLLGSLTEEEISQVRSTCSDYEILHNLPLFDSSIEGSVVRRSRSLDFPGYVCWKPNESEIRLFRLLKATKDFPQPSLAENDQFMLDYISKSLGLGECFVTKYCESVHSPHPLAYLASPLEDLSRATWATGVKIPPIEELSLSRQESTRVTAETLALRSQLTKPSIPLRLHMGTGEVYEVVDEHTGQKAIFKPAVQILPEFRDGKAGADRGADGGSFQDGGGDNHPPINSQAHKREIAAYLLDHFGFAGCLPTMEHVVSLNEDPSSGMIQRYLEHDQTADEDEWGLREINKLRPHEVHKIGILDVRMFNRDRHGGNCLLDTKSVAGETRLVPIDHELTLPSWQDLGEATFCWITWPQVRTSLDRTHCRGDTCMFSGDGAVRR